MFKTQVEPRAAGEWFHCQVLNILWRHFIVYKSIDRAVTKGRGPEISPGY